MTFDCCRFSVTFVCCLRDTIFIYMMTIQTSKVYVINDDKSNKYSLIYCNTLIIGIIVLTVI